MKTEQMPERISITTPSDMTQIDYSLFWVSPPCPGGEYVVKDTGHDYAEYVRADAAHWDAPNEPLKDGQYRWVRHKSTPGWLDVARVSIDHDGVWMNETGGDAYKSDQYVYIGPAIQPPEE